MKWYTSFDEVILEMLSNIEGSLSDDKKSFLVFSKASEMRWFVDDMVFGRQIGQFENLRFIIALLSFHEAEI